MHSLSSGIRRAATCVTRGVQRHGVRAVTAAGAQQAPLAFARAFAATPGVAAAPAPPQRIATHLPSSANASLRGATLVSPQEVAVSFADGSASTFHAVWLWYNAPTHFEPNSGQRTISANSVRGAPTLASASVTADGAGLSVVWSDGASGTYSAPWLKDHDYAHAAQALHREVCKPVSLGYARADLPPASVGGGGTRAGVASAPSAAGTAGAAPAAPVRPLNPPMDKKHVPTFDFADLFPAGVPPSGSACLASHPPTERALFELLKALNLHGLALIRGAPTTDRTVLQVGSRIADPMRTIYGEVWDVAVMPHPINIAYAPVMLDLHIDLVYYESPPGLQLLHCKRFDEGVIGGESTFMDGFEVAEQLRRRAPAAFATLARVPATFQKVHYNRDLPAHVVSHRPHIILDPRGPRAANGAVDPSTADVTGFFWAPQFEGPLRAAPEDVGPYYEAYATLAELIREMEADGRHLVQFRMEPGEVSIFNNRRMLHGRRTFGSLPGHDGAQRVLQGCYINADEYHSRYTTLARKYGAGDGVKRVGNQNIC